MEQRIFEYIAYQQAVFNLAMAEAFKGQTKAGYILDEEKNELRLFPENYKSENAMDLEHMKAFAWDWLQKVAYPSQPAGPVEDIIKGYHVYCEVDSYPKPFAVISPKWYMREPLL